MSLDLACPGCGHRFEADASLAGKLARCKSCGATFRFGGPTAQGQAEGAGPSGPAPRASRYRRVGEGADVPPAPKIVPAPGRESLGVGRLVAIAVAVLLAGLGLVAAFQAYRWATLPPGPEVAPPAHPGEPIRPEVLARHEPLMKRLYAAWEDMVRAYARVQDPESLRAVAPEIERLAADLSAVDREARGLPPLNASENARLVADYGPPMRRALVRVREEVGRIRSIPSMARGDFMPVLHAVDSAVAQLDMAAGGAYAPPFWGLQTAAPSAVVIPLGLDEAIEALVGAEGSGRAAALRQVLDAISRHPEEARARRSELAGVLAEALDAEDEAARRDAVRLLFELGGPESVPPLLAALGSPHVLTRLDAARTFAMMAQDPARREWLEAGRDAVVDALASRREDPNGEVRQNAFWALRTLGGPEVIPAMLEGLRSGDAESRAEAARQLEALAGERPEDLRASREAVLEALADLADGPGPHPYTYSLMGMLRRVDWGASPALLARWLRATDPALRFEALRWVEELMQADPARLDAGRPQVLEALGVVLRDRQGQNRGDAIRLLVHCPWPESLATLIGALDATAAGAREEILAQLVGLAQQNPARLAAHREALLAALDDLIETEPAPCWVNLQALLLALDWPEATPRLLRMLAADDRNLRGESLRALRERANHDPAWLRARRDAVAAALAGLMGERDDGLRGEAARMLLSIARPDDVPALARFLEGPENPARVEVMEALARMGDPRAAAPIAAYLGRDPDRAVRCLVALGPPAEPAALAALGELSGEVRRRACEVLREIGTSDSLERLRRVARDPDESVARAAEEAIAAIRGRRD